MFLDDYRTSGCAPSSSKTTTTMSTFWFELSVQTESIFFLRKSSVNWSSGTLATPFDAFATLTADANPSIQEKISFCWAGWAVRQSLHVKFPAPATFQGSDAQARFTNHGISSRLVQVKCVDLIGLFLRMFWTQAAASVPIIANNYRQSEADNPIIAPTTAPPSKRRIVPRTTAYESALPAVQRPKVADCRRINSLTSVVDFCREDSARPRGGD